MNEIMGDATSNYNTSSSQQLNYVETLWDDMYRGHNPLSVTGVFAFLLHEIVYFGRFIPFLICDMIPFFKKYKLQPVSFFYVQQLIFIFIFIFIFFFQFFVGYDNSDLY